MIPIKDNYEIYVHAKYINIRVYLKNIYIRYVWKVNKGLYVEKLITTIQVEREIHFGWHNSVSVLLNHHQDQEGWYKKKLAI